MQIARSPRPTSNQLSSGRTIDPYAAPDVHYRRSSGIHGGVACKAESRGECCLFRRSSARVVAEEAEAVWPQEPTYRGVQRSKSRTADRSNV